MGMTVKEYFIEEVISEPSAENHEMEGRDTLWPTGSRREALKMPLVNASGEMSAETQRAGRASALGTLAQVEVALLFSSVYPFCLKIPLGSLSYGLSKH